jgi:prophage antirepressor-like protein
MNQIFAFDFDSKNVRIVVDQDGEPWFVAADVCAALTVKTEQTRRLDADEKGLRIVQTLGGDQEMTVINESGLYSLILTSRKPEAKRFKRWVTHEVLPSIRKTGSYAAPGSVTALPAPTQDRVHAILMIGEAVAKVPGVKPGIAMAATLTCIHDNTGLVIEHLRRALPVANEPICSLNPTQLGERLELSARSVNLRLQSNGFQFKNDRDEWELTESGKRWAEALPYSRNGHSGYQILWNPEVVDMIKEAA